MGEKSYREIVITPVINGFVCKVGCSLVVFTDPAELAKAFQDYMNDPAGTEKKFREKAMGGGAPQPVLANPPEELRELADNAPRAQCAETVGYGRR